jgi:hypothetical protein
LVFPLKNKNEVGIGFVKILRDITAKKVAGRNKKYAKELEELNAHKENVLAFCLMKPTCELFRVLNI